MNPEVISRVILALVAREFPPDEDNFRREDILIGLHRAVLLYARGMRQIELREGGDPDDLAVNLIITHLLQQHQDDLNTRAVLQDV